MRCSWRGTAPRAGATPGEKAGGARPTRSWSSCRLRLRAEAGGVPDGPSRRAQTDDSVQSGLCAVTTRLDCPARQTFSRSPPAVPTRRFSMDSTIRRRLDVSAESTPSAEGSLSATFAARSAHTEGRAASSGHPLGRCSEALVSGIDGQPSATRLRGQRPATYCGRRMPPAAALSQRARRGGDSIRPGPARPRPDSSQPRSSPALMFRTCLRRRLRVACNRRGFDCAYGGAHPRRAAHPGGAASCSSPALRS